MRNINYYFNRQNGLVYALCFFALFVFSSKASTLVSSCNKIAKKSLANYQVIK